MSRIPNIRCFTGAKRTSTQEATALRCHQTRTSSIQCGVAANNQASKIEVPPEVRKHHGGHVQHLKGRGDERAKRITWRQQIKHFQ